MKEKVRISIYIVMFIITQSYGFTLYAMYRDWLGLIITCLVGSTLLGVHCYMHKKEDTLKKHFHDVQTQLKDLDDRIRKLSNSRF